MNKEKVLLKITVYFYKKYKNCQNIIPSHSNTGSLNAIIYIYINICIYRNIVID